MPIFREALHSRAGPKSGSEAPRWWLRLRKLAFQPLRLLLPLLQLIEERGERSDQQQQSLRCEGSGRRSE